MSANDKFVVVIGTFRKSDHERPWTGLFRRCSARLAKGEAHGYHGRCELRRGHPGVHALERGMEIVRFYERPR